MYQQPAIFYMTSLLFFVTMCQRNKLILYSFIVFHKKTTKLFSIVLSQNNDLYPKS